MEYIYRVDRVLGLFLQSSELGLPRPQFRRGDSAVVLQGYVLCGCTNNRLCEISIASTWMDPNQYRLPRDHWKQRGMNTKRPTLVFFLALTKPLKSYSPLCQNQRILKREIEHRDGILKLLRSSGIDSKEQIPPAYVVWRASTTTLFLLGSQPPQIALKFQHRSSDKNLPQISHISRSTVATFIVPYLGIKWTMAYRAVVPARQPMYSLTGRYDNPMLLSTYSSSQGL